MGIALKTNYPFEDDLTFTICSDKEATFPLYFRIPAWCTSASLVLNNEKMNVSAKGGKYVRLVRTWKNGDIIKLSLPKTLKVRTWVKNHNSVSVDYGPLTFSLKIGEKYIKKESDKTALWIQNGKKELMSINGLRMKSTHNCMELWIGFERIRPASFFYN